MSETAAAPSKKKIFISFDYPTDRILKNELVGQSQADDAGFKIANWSMKPNVINGKWLKEAKFHISRCDALVVLVGENTHTAPGVAKEIEIALSMDKTIIQLLAHPQNTPIQKAGTPQPWDADGLKVFLEK
ncbi:MAG: TIR domain-containing protein [Alphaproteobacteria bacterium]|nr:TIR domain-containing protein [Alphaproteobacteria bacterium]HPF47120.1 TIR domain-containing protein [Emcibacteraceae bacterium]HRW30867.1 TIR domain-containing protein [Emcibacteraceae bacterium]